jgi:hypothetical protein
VSTAPTITGIDSVSANTRWIELQQERLTTIGLVEFADLGGHLAEPS